MRILIRDEFTCQKCQKELPEAALEADHIIPLIQNGPDTDANKQTLCVACHTAKSVSEGQGRKIYR